MMSKVFTCMVDRCGATFPNQAAKNQHRMAKHDKKTQQCDPYNRRARMSARDAMDFADGCDLPDGAYWAMIEELSGAEPGDFA